MIPKVETQVNAMRATVETSARIILNGEEDKAISSTKYW